MTNKYFIGGSGNWSDWSSHWSLTSGGAPAALGSELVTNGGFAGNADGWTLDPGWTYGSDKITSDGLNNGAVAFQSIAITASSGQVCRVTFDIIDDSGVGDLLVLLGGGQSQVFSGNQSVSMDMEVKTVNTNITFVQSGFWVGSIDNISVKLSPVPVNTDNVIIDSNSGLNGGTLTQDLVGYCTDFTSSTGFSYTHDMSHTFIKLYGSMVLENGITFTDGEFDFWATSGSRTVTMGGCTSLNSLEFIKMGATYTLQDDCFLTSDGFFLVQGGTFDANGYDISAGSYYFYADTSFQPVVTMGSGIWLVIGNDDSQGEAVWYVDENDNNIVTFSPGTSTIKFTDATSNIKSFSNYTDGVLVGDGHTYNNIWFAGLGTGIFAINGSNIFNDFKVDVGDSSNILHFQNGTTTTVTTFITSGAIENLVTLNSDDDVNTFTLIKSGGGVFSGDYLSISNSAASPSNTWYAGTHSVDGGNNSGWLFQKYGTSIPTLDTKVRVLPTVMKTGVDSIIASGRTKQDSLQINTKVLESNKPHILL